MTNSIQIIIKLNYYILPLYFCISYQKTTYLIATLLLWALPYVKILKLKEKIKEVKDQKTREKYNKSIQFWERLVLIKSKK